MPKISSPHASSHQDGGFDEINVLDLSGELADRQKPKLGYALTFQWDVFNPEDGVTYFFGLLAVGSTTAAKLRKIYFRKTGTIKIAEIYSYAEIAGTAEDWSLYLRLNDTEDILIATVSVAASERIFSNTALGIDVIAGDYVEFKMVCPTWVTNPLMVQHGGYLYIE